MNNLGYAQAIQLQTALMPIAYLLCTLGLLLSVFRNWGNFHEILMTIVGILVIVVMANGYPTALTTVADGFKQLRQQTTANTPQETWKDIFSAKFQDPAWDQIAEKIALMLCQMCKWIGKISIWFLDWVQSWAFNGLIAISPVLIGALAVPWTQGAGITFLITSFGVAAWHLGIALVDILLASVATQFLTLGGIGGAITASTVISTGMLPVFLGILAGIICMALALYLAVPILIAAALRGGSPLTTGAKAGMEMALSALGMAGMVGGQIAARQAAGAATAGKDSPKTRKSRRGEEGDEDGGNAAPKPPTRPPGGSTLDTTTGREASSESSASATPAQRQSQILAGYDSSAPGRTGKPSANELERRKAEAMRVLGNRDENYT